MMKLKAETEGFEPSCRLPGKRISSAPRYDHFDTSPYQLPRRCEVSKNDYNLIYLLFQARLLTLYLPKIILAFSMLIH